MRSYKRDIDVDVDGGRSVRRDLGLLDSDQDNDDKALDEDNDTRHPAEMPDQDPAMLMRTY